MFDKNLAFILEIYDYHEFRDFTEKFNKMLFFLNIKEKIKYVELGYMNARYIGLFYFKKGIQYKKLRKEFLKKIKEWERKNYEYN